MSVPLYKDDVMNVREHANQVTYDQLPIEVQQAARVAHAKNADDLLVLDLRDSSAFTDWFHLSGL